MQQNPDRARAYSAIAQLQRLTELFDRRRVRIASDSGLSEQQWRLLEEISTEHFMPSLFARDRETSLPAVSKVIRQLLDKRLISVTVRVDDGRQRQYVLTAEGKRKLEKIRKLREQAIDAIWLRLDAAALEQFIDVSAQVIQQIEHYDKTKN